MGINFPASPTPGQKYPASPVGGLPTYTWDGEKWTTTTSTIEGTSYVVRSGDTMTGHLSLPTTPAAANAVRKDYVDGAIAAIPTPDLSSKVSKTGDTMSGHLTLPTGPAAANAVRKDYVDTAMAGVDMSSKVSKTGDTMSGLLTANAGVTVPTRGTESTGYCANTSYVETRANAWAYAAAGDRVAKSGDSMSGGLTVAGTITANGHCQTNSSCTIYSDQYFGAAAGSRFQIYGAGSYPTIAFHAPNYFGANFGMNTDGNFYMGGWSFGGGAAYKFWTTRDYGNNPVYCVVNNRLIYAGDQDRTPGGSNGSTDLGEPWDGTVVTQVAVTCVPQQYITGVSARFRYMQLQTATGNWYTAPYA